MGQGRHDLPDDFEEMLQHGFRYALSLTHDEPKAEDIVQDACMNMVKAGKPWRKNYFFSVIRNRFIDLHRRSNIVDIRSIDEKQQLDRNRMWAHNPQTESQVSNADALEKALKKINEVEREALYLSAVEEYTAGEISRLTGNPRNTVLSHIHRARRKLLSILGRPESFSRGGSA